MDGREMTFSELILGFSSAALSYLGYKAPGSPEKNACNLTLAQQNIRIIELLKEKTQGNLSLEEAQLTEHVLNDLRLRFVEASKAK